jgi:hypothetical protein
LIHRPDQRRSPPLGANRRGRPTRTRPSLSQASGDGAFAHRDADFRGGGGSMAGKLRLRMILPQGPERVWQPRIGSDSKPVADVSSAGRWRVDRDDARSSEGPPPYLGSNEASSPVTASTSGQVKGRGSGPHHAVPTDARIRHRPNTAVDVDAFADRLVDVTRNGCDLAPPEADQDHLRMRVDVRRAKQTSGRGPGRQKPLKEMLSRRAAGSHVAEPFSQT